MTTGAEVLEVVGPAGEHLHEEPRRPPPGATGSADVSVRSSTLCPPRARPRRRASPGRRAWACSTCAPTSPGWRRPGWCATTRPAGGSPPTLTRRAREAAYSGAMTDPAPLSADPGADAAPGADALAESLARVLGEYERHLVAERDLTPHTVRAYVADVAGLLEHATRRGCVEVSQLDLAGLRSWLAQQQARGRSRTTLARRATAARLFTAWLARTGRTPGDVGASLGSPRPHRTLPAVLRVDEAAALIHRAAEAADDGTPLGLRDLAVLELLYATGVRVGELVGLDVDDVDDDRRVLRVLGKGRKERAVPFGAPAARALDRLARAGAPGAGGAGRGAGAVPRRSRPAARPAGRASGGAPSHRRGRPARPTSARTACVIPPRPTCSRAAPTCARCRSSSATPRWPPRSATPTSPPSGCAGPTSRRTPAPEVDRASTRRRGGRRGPCDRGRSEHRWARGRRPRWGRRGAVGNGLVAPQRQQPDRSGSDQPQRVEVGRRPRSTPSAGSTAGTQCEPRPPAPRGADRHGPVPDRHGGPDGLVGRARRPVVHDDHPVPAIRVA